MNEQEKSIADYRKLIRENEHAVRKLTVNLGNQLFDAGTTDKPELAEAYARAADEKAALEKSRELLEEIRRILERKGAIKYQLRQAEEEIQSFERENSQFYQDIGEAAYRAYNSGNISGEGFAAVFSELMKQIVDLRKMEREIEDARQSLKEKAFFEKVIDQGRVAILSGNRAMKEKAIEKEYWRAGKELCSAGLLDDVEHAPVKEAVEPCVENRKKTENARELEKQLTAEDQSLDKTLNDLIEGKSPQKRLQEIERTIHDTHEALKSSLYSIGAAYLENRPEDIRLSQEMQKTVEDIETYQNRISENRHEIEKLEAASEAEQISEQIAELEKKIASAKEQIRRYTQDVKTMQADLKERKKERDRLEEVAEKSPEKQKKNGKQKENASEAPTESTEAEKDTGRTD